MTAFCVLCQYIARYIMNLTIKRNALYCILLITLLLLGSFAAILLNGYSQGTAYTAYIYQHGKLLHTITLSQVTAPYELDISTPERGFNKIQIKNASIGITEADCPDQICVNQGFISNSLLPITCLPHGLVIELKVDGHMNAPKASADAITH